MQALSLLKATTQLLYICYTCMIYLCEVNWHYVQKRSSFICTSLVPQAEPAASDSLRVYKHALTPGQSLHTTHDMDTDHAALSLCMTFHHIEACLMGLCVSCSGLRLCLMS